MSNARQRLDKYEPHPNCPQMKLRALVTRNGVRQYAIWCLEPQPAGHRPTRGGFIPHHIVSDYLAEIHMILDDVPVVDDHTCGECGGKGCESCGRRPCERCGSYEFVEWHHWAPQHLFDDANAWPTAYLCRECHRRWHSIVTPNMHLRRQG